MECCVCYCEEDLITSPCSHTCCKDCWSKISETSCPMCRACVRDFLEETGIERVSSGDESDEESESDYLHVYGPITELQSDWGRLNSVSYEILMDLRGRDPSLIDEWARLNDEGVNFHQLRCENDTSERKQAFEKVINDLQNLAMERRVDRRVKVGV